MININKEDLEQLLAYKKAKIGLHRSNLSQDERDAHILTNFSLGKVARRIHKNLVSQIISQMNLFAELLIISNHGSSWIMITDDKIKTLKLFKSLQESFGSGDSVYSIDEYNPVKRNHYVNVHMYNATGTPLMSTSDGWYYNKSKIKTQKEKIQIAWNLGYVVTRKKSPSIVRPRLVTVSDISMVEKLYHYYETQMNQSGYTLRNDFKSTIRRFQKNYDWPTSDKLPKL